TVRPPACSAPFRAPFLCSGRVSATAPQRNPGKKWTPAFSPELRKTIANRLRCRNAVPPPPARSLEGLPASRTHPPGGRARTAAEDRGKRPRPPVEPPHRAERKRTAGHDTAGRIAARSAAISGAPSRLA